MQTVHIFDVVMMMTMWIMWDGGKIKANETIKLMMMMTIIHKNQQTSQTTLIFIILIIIIFVIMMIMVIINSGKKQPHTQYKNEILYHQKRYIDN